MTTLADILRDHPSDDTAIVIPGGPTVGFGYLRDEVERVAELLAAAGLERGRAVSIVLTNGLEFIITFLSVTRAGAIAAPLNPAYTVDEFLFFMEDAGAQLAILPEGDHPGRTAAGQLGIPVLDAALNAGPEVVLSREGAPLTTRTDVSGPVAGDVALFLHTSGTTSRPRESR